MADKYLAIFQNQLVLTPRAFKEAYAAYAYSGQALAHPTTYGGQALLAVVNTMVSESLSGVCTAFSLCPLLTASVIETINVVGTKEQKELYLPQLIAGRWSGTMNLIEAQAGSDLSQIRSIAKEQDDGS